VGKCNPAGILKDIVHRYPVLAGGLHAYISACVGVKPPGEFLKATGEGREAAYLVRGNAPLICRGNAGNDKLFVDIDSATDRIYYF